MITYSHISTHGTSLPLQDKLDEVLIGPISEEELREVWGTRPEEIAAAKAAMDMFGPNA